MSTDNPVTRPIEMARVVAGFGIVLLALWLLPLPLPADIPVFTAWHTLLEIFAVSVAFLVFAVGWLSYQRRAPLPILVIAAGFLAVGLLDIAHLLSFPGMPDWVTPADPEKAINFWLAARFVAALVLLYAALGPWKARPYSRPVRQRLVASALLVVLLFTALFLRAPDWLPATFDPEDGLTPFKIISEYLVVVIHLATAVLLWRRRHEIDAVDVMALITAVLLIALSELFFTLYSQPSDVFNLMGHVYKIAAYYYLYRAVVLSGIAAPYRSLAHSQHRLEATLEALPDMVFEVDRRLVVHHFHSRYSLLLSTPEEFVGRSLADAAPAHVVELTRQLLADADQRGTSAPQLYTLEFHGEVKWYEATASILAVEHLADRRYVLVVRDVTDRLAAEQALGDSQRFIETALDNMPIGVAVNSIEPDVTFSYMNDNFPLAYGTTREALSGNGDFFSVVYQDPVQREELRRRVLDSIASGEPSEMIWEAVPIKREGEPVRYVTGQNVPLPEPGIYMSLVTDVTRQVENEQELKIAAVAFHSSEGVVITDADQRILRVNRAFTELTGYTEEEVKGKSPAILQSGQHDAAFYQRMWKGLLRDDQWRGEVWNRRKDGSLYSQQLNISVVRDAAGAISHFVATFVETTALRRAEERLEKLALYDPLTGLGNRQLMIEELDRQAAACAQQRRFGAALLIDLDQFKKVNETLGFEAGDQLLGEVAERLRLLASSDEQVFRHGVDDFLLLVSNAGKSAAAAASHLQARATKVLEALNDGFLLKGRTHFNQCSIGGTVFSGHATRSAEILKQLAVALHQVRELPEGQQFGFFDPVMQDLLDKEVRTEAQLRKVLEGTESADVGCLMIHLQPRVDETGALQGAEALVRWQHPARGLISPAEFLPLAERAGLMRALERRVLDMAMAVLSRWQADPARAQWQMAVNLSSSEFYRDSFESELLEMVALHGVRPEGLSLEFTESTLLSDVSQARERIARLGQKGFRFSIDDFGTGYSSLAYLGQLPVHELKIDQSFVRGMLDEAYSAAIVRMVIEMADVLGMEVVAEGVETAEQLAALLSQGCRRFQGYGFSPPVDLERFETLPARLVIANSCPLD
ncbi:MAG: bifunctional diguanylate cyclase/phosphodiesterase [Wenzhouxiangella sp.]